MQSIDRANIICYTLFEGVIIVLSERLIKLRTDRNMKQDDVAEQLGIKRQTYGAYERNVSSPDVQTLMQLADLFDVSVDYLLGREERANTPDADALIKLANHFKGSADYLKETVSAVDKSAMSKYENALSKYGPLATDLNTAITQILEHGISLEKPAEIIDVLLKLHGILYHLYIALESPADTAKEVMIAEKLKLLDEIMLDGSPAQPSKKPSNMLYMLSYMSIHIDKAIIAKNELNALLDEFLRVYTSTLLSLRFRLAALKDEAEQEAADDGKHN